MTIAERNNKLKHFITCLKCEVSGKCCDDNCSIQYEAGNMGEIIENLEAISKALEQGQITKNNLVHNLCDSCTNIGCEFQSGIVRKKCAFYMPPHIEPDKCGNYIVQDSTTKNDLAQERYQDLIEYFGDEKVAKTILESRKEFKAWLERLRWNVKRADELARESEQIKGTTKNYLGVDCISREAVERIINKWLSHSDYELKDHIYSMTEKIHNLPSVTPIRPKGHWIDTNYHQYYNDGDIETTELKCSCCNEEVEWDIELLHKPYFCENCGAKMESEEV